MESLSSFYRWMKLVLAYNWFVTIITSVVIGAILLVPMIEIGIDLFYWGHFKSVLLLESSHFLSIGCIGFAAYYGLLRVVCFHPLYADRYHQWLVNSPWEMGLSLPKGPLHLVWQDFALLGILTPFSAILTPYESQVVAWLAPSTAMASSLTFFWAIGNQKAKQFRYNYALLIVLPLAFSAGVKENIAIMQLALIACAVIAYAGARSSLKGLREQHAIDFRNVVKSMNEPVSVETWSNRRQLAEGMPSAQSIAWPYDKLLVAPKEFRRCLTRAWFHSLIVMIWAYLFYQINHEVSRNDELSFQYIFWYFIVFLLAGWRMYCGAAAICPRLCIGERLANRKLFLAKHDRLILEPLAIILCCYLPVLIGKYCSSEMGNDEFHRIGLMIGPIIGTFVHHTIGKPIEDAFYTGPQSIAPAQMTGAKQKQFAKLASPGD